MRHYGDVGGGVDIEVGDHSEENNINCGLCAYMMAERKSKRFTESLRPTPKEPLWTGGNMSDELEKDTEEPTPAARPMLRILGFVTIILLVLVKFFSRGG